ncbi:MAG: DUF4347 domain-containing protein [Magnetococcales bacterium]|nr:DUF4347 domain-containing protein [Magnetococcales bacterium]
MSTADDTNGTTSSDNRAVAAPELLFIDRAVTDAQTLASHVRAGMEVFMLADTIDPWQQISDVLAQHSNVRAIHLVSHGRDGLLWLGGREITSASLADHADLLTGWSSHLAAGADLLLYGCDVAAGDAGAELMARMAQLTAADVAASTDATGQGGNWTLEATTGVTETASAFDASVDNDYRYRLATAVPGTFTGKTGINVNTTGVTTGLIGAGKKITFDPVTVTSVGSGSVALLLRNYDVDYGLKNSSGTPYVAGDPKSEWDGVYLQEVATPTTAPSETASAWTFVGYLNGTNNTWNTTTLDISTFAATNGAGNYVVRIVPDDNATQTQNHNSGPWVVGITFAQIIVDGGAATGASLSVPTETGQTVTATVTPKTSGNFIVEYNLIDASGRDAAAATTAVSGLTANVAKTVTSTLAPNTNFYSSWSSIPSGTYTLEATLLDTAHVVQQTQKVSYSHTQSSSASGATTSSKVTITDLKTWYGNTPADLAHQATSDTSAQQLTIKGKLATTPTRTSANVTIQELVNGSWTSISSTKTIGKVSSWEVNLSSDLSVGSHTLRAKYRTSSFGSTYYSPNYALVVDTPSTITPVITGLASNSWTGSSAADLASQLNPAALPHTTANQRPTVTGTSGPLAALNIYDGTTLLGYTTASSSGTWSFSVPAYAQLSRSTTAHSLTAKDVGANRTSSAYALVIDSTAPTQTITIDRLSNDTGSSAFDFVTSEKAQTIYGTMSAGLTGTQTLWGTINGGGNWVDVTDKITATTQIVWDNQTLYEGYYEDNQISKNQMIPWSIQFKVTDSAGQDGAVASQTYQVMISTGVPNILIMADSAVSPVTTNKSYPVISGDADAGVLVDVYLNDVLKGTVATDVTGNWSWAPSTTVANGTYTVKAVERNALTGYTSVDSTTKTLTVNTTLPSLTLNSSSDLGSYNDDAITSDDTPTLRVDFSNIGVNLTAGTDQVRIFADGSQVGSVTVTSTHVSNKYVDITTSTLGSDGYKTLSAQVVRGATTYQSVNLGLTLDRTAPLLATAEVDGDSVTLHYDEAVGFDVAAPALANFTVKANGTTQTVDGLEFDPIAGEITLMLASPVAANATVTVSYINTGTTNLTDLAGNKAAALSNRAVTNLTDNSAPTLVSIERQDPLTATTNADAVTFRVTFADSGSGGVIGVDETDFVATLTPNSGTATQPSVSTVTRISALVYDVTVDDAAIAQANGTLRLALNTQANGMDITDQSSAANPLANNTTVTGSYTLDNSVSTPINLDLAAVDDSGLSDSDDITSHTSGLTISGGGGEAGSTLVLFADRNGNSTLDSGEALATTAVTSANWSTDVALPVGIHAVQAVQTDTAGSSATSAALTITVVADDPIPSKMTISSASSDGTQANDGSFFPSISADGRYVAFWSFADNLVSGDTNQRADVFVRDRQNNTVTRISVSSSGAEGNGHSSTPSISPDGGYVVFYSSASNLVSGDTNNKDDVFLYDLANRQISRVSIANNGSQATGSSGQAAVSYGGRYVAFQSNANNLVSGDSNGSADIFVRDRVDNKTWLVSLANDGKQGNGLSIYPSISADGSQVAFHSAASNLVSGDSNGMSDVFVRDLLNHRTTRVSVASDGSEGDGDSSYASISFDGDFVAFQSEASNLVSGDNNTLQDVLLRNLITNQTELVSVASNGTAGDGPSYRGSVAYLGSYVAFHSEATSLTADDGNSVNDLLIRDRLTSQTVRASVSDGGAEGNGSSWYGSMAADASAVAFHSDASNLTPAFTDNNGETDILVKALDYTPLTPIFVPVPASLNLADADDNGFSNGDNITNQTSNLTISGNNGAAGSKIVLFDDQDRDGVIDSGEALVTTAVTGSNWQVDTRLAFGSHALRAIQNDSAGNNSRASAILNLVVLPSGVQAASGVATVTLTSNSSLLASMVDSVISNSGITDTVTLLTSSRLAALRVDTIVSSDGAVDTVTLLGGSGRVVVSDIDSIIGSSGSDTIVLLTAGASALSDIETVLGSAGNDVVTLLGSDQLAISHIESIVGTSGTDTVRLLTAASVTVSSVDTLIGAAGAETVTLLQSPLTISAVSSVIGSTAADTLTLLADSSVIVSGVESIISVSNDTVTLLATSGGRLWSSKVDSLIGSSASDTVTLAAANRTAISAVEVVLGSLSTSDTVALLTSASVTISAVESVIGSSGVDTVQMLAAGKLFTTQVDSLIGSSGQETVTLLTKANLALAGIDTLTGSASIDTVTLISATTVILNGIESVVGSSGSDTITMKNSGVVIWGGDDADIIALTESSGKDTIVMTSVSHSSTTDVDRIVNFQGTDVLFFSGLKTGSFTTAALLTQNQSFTNTGKSQLLFNSTTGQLQVDSDGDGTTDMKINLPGVKSLKSSNFAWSSPKSASATSLSRMLGTAMATGDQTLLSTTGVDSGSVDASLVKRTDDSWLTGSS